MKNHQWRESILDFVAEFWNLSKNYHFATLLDNRLRDELVMGINDNRIQRRLLAEKDTMTFQENL